MARSLDLRVSVVIPSYNHARFVSEAIESVARQDHCDVELVVVDDGSTDGSPSRIRDAIQSLTLSRVVFIEQPNAGTQAAIARGFEEATGDVLTILNSDDRFAPGRLRRVLENRPLEGDFLAFSSVRMIDAAGSEFVSSSEAVRGYRHALYEATRCPTIGFALLRNNFAVTSGNLVFSRGLYERLGGFASFKLAHDWDFLLRALLFVEPIFVPEPLLDYRTHGTNTRFRLGGLAVEEGRAILENYLEQCRKGSVENQLAPCAANWPVYFELFVSRYSTWFGSRPIREWFTHYEGIRGTSPEAWRSWSEAVDFERVDDSGYLVATGRDPAVLDTLAIARDVLLSASRPLADEVGPGDEALANLFDRLAHPRPRFRRPPWTSPYRPSEQAGGQGSGDNRWTWRVARMLPAELLRVGRGLRDLLVVGRSGLFDTAFYADQCEDGRPGILHYLRGEAAEGLNPHPLFDTSYYLRGALGARGMNPLVHFLLSGGRQADPNPLFDCSLYLDDSPDVERSTMNPLLHYLRYGASEGRRVHKRFDAKFYLSRLDRELAPDETPLGHYFEKGRRLGIPINAGQDLRLRLDIDAKTHDLEAPVLLSRSLRFSGFFDADYYRDHAAIEIDGEADPVHHFLDRGAIEGLPFCPREVLEQRLASTSLDMDAPELSYLRVGRPPTATALGTEAAIYVSSRGNHFFREMAELLAHGFASAGVRSRVLNESTEPVAEGHSIIVAPHEFFVLGEGPKRLSRAFLERSSLWLAEQPGSVYFSMCLWFARLARRVLDINPRIALAWAAMGFEARAFPLGYLPTFPLYADRQDLGSEALRWALPVAARTYTGSVDDPLVDRPVEVSFNGVASRRREEFLARHANLFSELRCAFLLPISSTPVEPGLASSLTARDATALAQRSQILLNIHRDSFPYFEWHRLVVRGIWQRCLVVTEPSLSVPWLKPGKHYVECELDEIPERIRWLLRSKEGRMEAEVIRTRAFEALKTHYSLAGVAAAFLEEDAG